MSMETGWWLGCLYLMSYCYYQISDDTIDLIDTSLVIRLLGSIAHRIDEKAWKLRRFIM